MLKRILFLVLFCGQLFPQTTLNGSASASGVVSLGTAGTGVALVSITISPQNPVISYVSQQSFTANGTYSNSTSGDVTNLATWTSSNPAVATNVGPNFQCVARGSVTVTASYQGVNGTTTLTCQSPTMSPLSGSTVQSASSQTIMQYTGANGVSPFTFSISGQPSGWTLSSTGCPSGQVNCSLVGIPATVGTFNFFVQATDNLGNTACAPPGCAISVNVYAAGAEDDKYCTLVGSVETITGLAMDGPANPMQNCNFTELLSTAGLAYNSLSTPVGTGTGTTVHVCSVSSTVVPCGSLIPVAGGGANAATVYCYSSGFIAWGAAGCTTLGNGPFYTKQVQGAINFVSGQINNVNTGLGNLCGALISVQAYYLPGGIGAATQAVYQEPTVNPPTNLNCGPDFGQPWVWLATDQLNLSTLAIAGLAPGNRISPAYVGQGSITGRPAYAQVAGGNYPAMPMLKCESQQPGGENCTFLNSQSGAIISGLRVMGIDFSSPHGRENTFDLYGNPACTANDNNTPQCSPGSTGPEVFVGCQVVSKTICLSPISGTVNTTNSSSGACPANCVTWQSWNAGVSGAEQYNFSMFIPGDPVNIGATQYTVGTLYSNTLMSVTTAPGTQTGATYTPYTGSYHVVFDRDLFEACDDHTFATCYDIMETGLQMQSGQHLSVIDSYFIGYNCLYAIGPCTDSHPILGGLAENSNDFAQKVVNNYLEASGENFFWGGGNSLGYPADIEVRRNHLYKPLTWKVDTPLYPGTVNDAWVNKQNSTPYVSAPSCNVSLPQQGSCTDGQSCAATCTAISTGGGTSWTITDVLVTNGGSGYGIGVKGNGKTYATNPNFTFTDTSGTYTSCNAQLSGTANVSAPNGSGISTVTWLSGDKFTEKAFRGTNASIQFTSNPSGGSWTGTPNTFSVTYVSSTSVTFTFSGTQVLPVNNVIWTSVFPTRGDCVYPLIGFYNVKNDGEVKNGIRILEEGNVFENSWNGQSDQTGFAHLIDPKNANDGCPQCQISDWTYRYNFTRNSTEGMQIAIATATQCSMTPCLPVAMTRLSVHDDVFDAMNGYQWSAGSAPVNTFADTCAFVSNAQSPAFATSFLKINHITCIGTEPWTASALTSGSFLELFYSANYGANGTTPAVLQGVTLENSIGAGGVKNYAANSNGAIACTTEACKDHSTQGSTSPTAAALDSLLSSSFLGTPSGGVYPANIVTAVILPNGSRRHRRDSGKSRRDERPEFLL